MIRLMAVEDNPALRRLLEMALREPEFELRTVADGLDALPAMLAYRPEVLLLDAMLPGISGLEVCRRLRAHPDLRSTRVIMLTARAQKADREAAIAAGVDQFIGKPFRIPELRDAIRVQASMHALA